MKTMKILGALLLAAWSTGCMSTFVGKPKANVAAGNEIVLTSELKTLLGEIPKPKIVIRVPNPPANVTEAEKFNAYINQIEKVFIQNGYTVRDRALLENLMRSGNLDYKSIKDKIDTDLIIDILGLEFDIPNPVKTFFNETTQKEEPFGSPENYIDCMKAKLECRLTIVDKGQLGGLMTLFASRCDSENLEIYVDGFRQKMAWTNNFNGVWYPALNTPFPSEEVKKAYTEVLTNALIGQLAGQLGARLQQAIDAANGRDYARALEILNDLIAKDPRNFAYYLVTGTIAARQGDFVKGQQELDKALGYASSPSAKMTTDYAWANFYSLKKEKEPGLAYLKKIFDAGFRDFARIEKEEDMAFLRAQPEYAQMAAAYKTNPQPFGRK